MRLSYLITGAAVLILLACGVEQVALIRILWLLGVVALIGGVIVAIPAYMEEYSPATVRQKAAVLLAAADRAERMATEAKRVST